MKKYIVGLLTCLATTLTAASIPAPYDTTTPTYWKFASDLNKNNYLDNSVVKVGLIGHDGKAISFGTGFFIGENLIATARHVVDGDYARIYIRMQDAKRLGRAEVVAISEKDDVAILRLTTRGEVYKRQQALELNPTVTMGETVYSYGYGMFPLRDKTLDLRGQPLGAKGMTQVSEHGLLYHSAEIFGGHSGGPLFDTNGKVVGINVSKHFRNVVGLHEELGYRQTKYIIMGAEPIQDLLDLLKEID